MNRNAEYAIKKILEHEGGYVNHPSDPGGATNKGITIATYRRYIKRSGTIADLKAMTEAQAITVYLKKYWDKVKADDLPSGIDYTVADFAVNSGPARAAKYLQAALGVTVDGKIGPQTIAAAHAANANRVINRICESRLAFMKRIKGGKLWKTFGRGWSRRVADVRASSLDMAMNVADIPVNVPADPPPSIPQAMKEEAEAPQIGLFAALWGIIFGVKK